MNNEIWYPLETSAKIYPAIISPRQPSVFRLSCTFNKEIDPDILSGAATVDITGILTTYDGEIQFTLIDEDSVVVNK